MKALKWNWKITKINTIRIMEMTVIKYLLRVLKKMIESNHLQLQFLLCLAHKFAFYLKLSLLMKQIPRIIKELILLLLIMPLISFNLQLLDCLIAV